MTFTRPKNVTLTEMAQWVDSIDVATCDQEILVQYLYHLVICNARQHALFKDDETYDDFALFSVSKLLTRLQNTNVVPIKSIVNYIKNVIQHWSAEYIRAFCCGSPDIEICNFDVTDFADYLIDVSGEQDHNIYNVGCLSISDAIRKHMLRLPRKRYSAEWGNIYISCLLTLEDRITTAINFCGGTIDPSVVNSIVKTLKLNPPILFHIDECWSNYILVIVNEIIHAIAVELTYDTSSKVTPSACLKNLVIAASNEEED